MTKADQYQNMTAPATIFVPHGGVSAVQVIVFDDDSIHVRVPDMDGDPEEIAMHAMKSGLELLGYRVELEHSDAVIENPCSYEPGEEVVH